MDGLGATRRSSKKLVFPFYALSHGLASSRERNEQATSIGKGLCLLVQTVPPAFLSVRVSFYRIGKRRDLRTVWRRESPAPRRHASVVTFNPRRSQASTPLPSFFFFFFCFVTSLERVVLSDFILMRLWITRLQDYLKRLYTCVAYVTGSVRKYTCIVALNAQDEQTGTIFVIEYLFVFPSVLRWRLGSFATCKCTSIRKSSLCMNFCTMRRTLRIVWQLFLYKVSYVTWKKKFF